MRKMVLGAIIVAGMAGSANAATLFTSNFDDGGFGGFTPVGQVQNLSGADYVPCCGTTGNLSNRFISFGSGDQPSGTFSRLLETTLGKAYTVTFDFGALGGGADPITVSYGSQVQAFSRAANNDLTQTFAPASFTFTGTGNLNRLQFVSAGAFGADGVIDNVSVSAVPEASTWAMMIFGVGAVGGSLRQRNRRAVGPVAA